MDDGSTMPKFYKYVFFRLYQWNLSWKGSGAEGDSDLARAFAQTQLFMLIMINVWTLLEAADYVFKTNYSFSLAGFLVQYHSGAKRLEFLIIGFLVLTLIGSYKPYWVRILKDMEKFSETSKQRHWRAVGLCLFVVGSAVAFFELMNVGSHAT
jgi:hypothetical protein